MFSTDRSILEPHSDVRRRMIEYGALLDSLHIILYTRRRYGGQRAPCKLSQRVIAYPTCSRTPLGYFYDAYRLGKHIIQHHVLALPDTVLTTQDPFEMGIAGYILKMRFRLPLQMQVHVDFLSPYFWRESLKNKFRVFLARFLLARADGIRVVSERIKHSLISDLPACQWASRQLPTSRIVVFPIFIDIEKICAATTKTNLHEKYREFDFIILMASRLTKEKNIGMAIEAIHEVITQHPKTLLLIVGDGPEQEKLKVKREKLNVNANVIFEPAMDFATLISYYKTADLFLLTSNYEGYGRTVIEALAAGCPVVMTDVGVARELTRLTKAFSVVSVENSAALKDAIVAMMARQHTFQTLLRGDCEKIEAWIGSRREFLARWHDLFKETVKNFSA